MTVLPRVLAVVPSLLSPLAALAGKLDKTEEAVSGRNDVVFRGPKAGVGLWW
jgi:hypothetical protein